MQTPESDPVIARLRGQIAHVDHALVEGINERLRLVTELKRHKDSRGIAFVDRARERQILEDLAGANEGPLSPEGLRELLAAILELTKREVSRRERDA